MARERSNGEKGRNLCCNVAVLTWSEEREGERERERERERLTVKSCQRRKKRK